MRMSATPTSTSDRSRAIATGLLVAVAVLVASIAFSGALTELVNRWIRQDEYSHGFFIPVIAAWLLVGAARCAPRQHRAAVLERIGADPARGVDACGGRVERVLSPFAGRLRRRPDGHRARAPAAIRLLKVTFLPIFFLLFAIPLPYFIDSVLSFRLQLISSELGVFFIRLFGIPVYLEGNVIDLGPYKLQVVEACSGLRYLYPLLSLGFLAAYLFQAPLWQRALVFLSTIPITIVMNSFRIGMVGVLVDYSGPQDADGLLHFFEGWIIFIACGALLAAEIYLLARLRPARDSSRCSAFPRCVASLPRGAQSTSAHPGAGLHRAPVRGGRGGLLLRRPQEIVPERARFVAFPKTHRAVAGTAIAAGAADRACARAR